MSETDSDLGQVVKKPRLDTTAHISLIDDIDEKNPFTEGNAADEIELKFDEGKSLFVSKSFLSYSSPVFERMFQSAFKERDGTSVDLKEKSYDAFLEMLLFLHPRVQKTIPDETAKLIYQVAHEYQIPTVLKKAETILLKQTNSFTGNGYNDCFYASDKREYCTEFLSKAFEMLN